MIRACSQKRKAAVIVINSYLSSAPNCVIFFRTAMKSNREMKNVKIPLLVWNSLAYSVAFFYAMLSITNKFA